MTISFIASIFIISLITAIASAAHGGNFFEKGPIMIIHASIVYAVSYFLLKYSAIVSLAAIPIVAIWWFILRRAAQAKSELNYQSKTKSNKLLAKVAVSYFPAYFVFLSLTTQSIFLGIGLVVASLISVVLTSVIFHKDTSIGRKLQANAIAQVTKTQSIDRVYDQRRAVEFVTGLFPGGAVIIVLLVLLPAFLTLINYTSVIF